MPALKCPNQACPYLFDPSGVPAGVVLTCPRCGMRFTLGSQAGATPPAASDLDFGDPAEIARPRARRDAPTAAGGSGTRTTIALVVVSFALLAGVGATVYFRLFHNPARLDRDDPTAELADKNLALDPPGAGWVRDDALRAKLGPPFFLAFRKGDPDQRGEADPVVAFAAKDYATRDPRAGELKDGLLWPLGAVFDDLNASDRPGERWLGRPAAAADFDARLKGDGPLVAGQAHAAGYKGFGYWVVGWAAKDDAAFLEELAALRAKVRPLGGRAGWAPQAVAARTFSGRKLPYEVVDGDGLWAEPDPAEVPPGEVDPAADLLLVAKQKQKGRDFAPEATVVVAVLDNLADDPLAAGRKHAEDRRAAEVREATGDAARAVSFADLPDSPEGVLRLRSTVPDDKNQSRLYVVAAVRIGDKVAAAHGWCAWADRAVFEDHLVKLVGSLREKK